MKNYREFYSHEIMFAVIDMQPDIEGREALERNLFETDDVQRLIASFYKSFSLSTAVKEC